jgi:GNAT superfamily N-acetyltransferase
VQLRRLEEVAMNAWPALQQALVDGWVLRFANGYTKRANSVNPLYESQSAIDAKIALCEHCYAAKRLPAIFRLTSCLAPPELDAALERRGYGQIDPSLVLSLDLRGLAPAPDTTTELRDEELDGWMAQFEQDSTHGLWQHDIHRSLLQAIPAQRLLAVSRTGGQRGGCAVGVLEGEYFGIFDLVVAPGRRNQGHGTRLVVAMLHWARQRGARYAYLQVVSANAPARHVYGKLGFREAYRYWYRAPYAGAHGPGHAGPAILR